MRDDNRLNPSAVSEILPLTPLQEGMLLHVLKSEGDRYIYWIRMRMEISGPLDRDLCRRAWERVAEENPMLRTAVRWENIKQPVQVVLKDHPLALRFDCDAELPRLESVPFGVTVERTGEESHVMTVICHHILLDGWSTGIMFRDFFAAYEALRLGGEPCFGSKLLFGDFIRWSREQDQQAGADFWDRYLDSEADGVVLPRMLPGISPRRLEGAARKPKGMAWDWLPERVNAALQEVCAALKVPQSAIWYAAWGLVLNRYCGLSRLLFGTTVAGRPAQLADVDNTVGMFINTIPLSILVDDDCPVEYFLRNLAGDERERREFETTPLTAIGSAVKRSLPLFDTAVVLENYPLPRETVPESLPFAVEGFDVEEQTDFNLSLTVSGEKEPRLGIEYAPELFSKGAIQRLRGHLRRAVAYLTGDPTARLGDLDILSEQERNALLVEYNATAPLRPERRTVHQWFRTQALKTPDAVAVADASVQVSYSRLLDESLAVAEQLRKRGIGGEEIVAIAGFRNAGTPSGLLGIMFAGGAYLPVEPELPTARINLLLRDSGARILLASGDEPLPDGLDGVEILRDWGEVNSCEAGSEEPFDRAFPSSKACYVMYTSGSTGMPKGVVVEHRAVCNVLAWYGARYQMGPGKHVLQMTGFSFDPSVEDLLGTILFGGAVWIGPRNLYVDPEAFRLYVERRRVYLIDFIPAILDELLGGGAKIACLEVVISGGERLEPAVKDRLLSKGYRVHNHYGPTETTVDALAGLCDGGDVHLGGPVANMRAYALDSRLRPAPLEMPGELCVAGLGVARGYLNNPELTAERFVADPFHQGAMMYRSGDQARWTEGRVVEFIGRLDHQVKIRGQRVELAEVERRILDFPLVSDCVVLHKKGRGGGRLAAFVVPLQSAAMKQKDRLAFDLRNALERELPEAMIPSSFLAIDTIPRSGTGKPDRAALDALDAANPMLQQTFVAPNTPEEQALAGFWLELLDIDKIGVTDDFFKIGGNSLLLVRLYGMINKQFPNKVSVQDLFDHRTIRSLAGKLADHPESDGAPGKQKSRKIAF
jgi:amino acid adenylation domain-containing protein